PTVPGAVDQYRARSFRGDAGGRRASRGHAKRRQAAGRSLLVPVTAECGARRGHRGRLCALSERRDGDQQDQSENSDEYPHDTSPHDISPYCGTLSRRQVKVTVSFAVACDDPILGYCFPLRRCPSPIADQRGHRIPNRGVIPAGRDGPCTRGKRRSRSRPRDIAYTSRAWTLQSRIAAARPLLIPSLRCAKLGVASAETASPAANAVRNLLILIMISLLIFLSRIISVAGSRGT